MVDLLQDFAVVCTLWILGSLLQCQMLDLQLQCSMVVNHKLAWGCLLLGWLCQIIQVNLSMGLPIRKLHGCLFWEEVQQLGLDMQRHT